MKHSTAYSTALVAAVIAGTIAIPIDVNDVDSGLYSRTPGRHSHTTPSPPPPKAALPVDNSLTSTDGTTLPNAQTLDGRALETLIANYDTRSLENTDQIFSRDILDDGLEVREGPRRGSGASFASPDPSNSVVMRDLVNSLANSLAARNFDDDIVLQARMFKKALALLGAVKDTVVSKIQGNPANKIPLTDNTSSSSDGTVVRRELDSRAFDTLKANYDLRREKQKEESAAIYKAKAQ
ncbi:hypothetical protein H0H93_016561, partial [Arthromyces matolae]